MWFNLVLLAYVAPVSVSLQSNLKPFCSYKSCRPLDFSAVGKPYMTHHHSTILYATSSSSSALDAGLSNSTSVESFSETDSMVGFSNKPPKRGPFAQIKKVLLLFATVVKVMIGKILPSSGNKTVNNAFDTSRKRRNSFEKLGYLLYLQLTSRRFWIQLIFLFSSFSILSKILRFSRSLVTEVSYSSFLKLVSSSPGRISDLKISPSQFSYLLDGRSSFTRPVPLAPAMVDLLVSKGLEFSSPASPINLIGTVQSALIFVLVLTSF